MIKSAMVRISSLGIPSPCLPQLLRTGHWRFSVILLLFLGLVATQTCFGQNPVEPEESGPFPDVMLRERRWSKLLIDIESQLAGRQSAAAIAALQHFFDSVEDNLLPRSDRHGVSMRSGAAKLLREAGEDIWASYEKSYGPDANRLLERADENGSVSGYHEVIRRYAQTSAGAIAFDRLANWYFERHDYDLAATCWNRLLSNPVHAKRITLQQRFKFLIAASRSGISADFQSQIDSLQSQKISLNGQSRSVAEWDARLKTITAQIDSRPEDSRLFGGGIERNRIIDGSAPFLYPSFKLSLFDSLSPAAVTPRDRHSLEDANLLLESELSDRRSAGMPSGFAGSPLVTNELILFRDALGIRALDRRQKNTLWTYRTKSTLTVESSTLSENDSTNLRQSSFLQNSVLCQLACDERQVYFVDQISIPEYRQSLLQFEPPELNPRVDGKLIVPSWNRLVALRMNVAANSGDKDDGTKRVAWTLGGHPFDDPESPHRGHFFLGPPLPLGEILYAISEFEKHYYLTALQPENGHVLWRQTLAYVPIPSRETPLLGDRMRLAPASFISGSRGILVCPLSAGVLVGIDQLTGEFVWTYDYRWRPKSVRFPSNNLHSSVEQSFEADFPNPPLTHGGRVFFLAPGEVIPSSVDHLHCLDLKTGKRIWHSEIRDSKYIAVLNSERVLAIGANHATALNIKDGSIAWSRRVPVICGVGAAIPEGYLLPLNEDHVIFLKAEDGSEIGHAMPVPGVHLGNLSVQGRDVISENGLELQIFPQAAEHLSQLAKLPVSQRETFAHLLETGQVYFRLGQVDEAKVQLKRALQSAKSETDRASVLEISRELAWREMLRIPDQRRESLAEYAGAAETPEHFAQLLLAKGEEAIRQSDWVAANQTARELLDLNVEKLLRSLNDPERQITPEAWCATLVDRTQREAPATAARLLEDEPSVQAMIDEGNPARLRSYLLRHPHTAESARIRLVLARKLVDEAQSQAAEFAVWDDHLGNDSVALEASKFLVELWSNAGLYDEAGKLLSRIGFELADVKSADGQSGREYYSNFPHDSLVWSAAQRFVAIDWDVDRVTISEHHEIDRRLKGTFANWPRNLNFPDSTHQLFLFGQATGQAPPFSLRQINMETGSVVSDFVLPNGGKVFYPHQFLDPRQRLGHFLPSAGLTNCFGISLLDRGIVWQRVTSRFTPANSVPWIGPATPRVCIFRSRNRLVAVDPSSGRLLWERTDLEEVPRPLNNLSAMPGDSDVILVVEPDDDKTYHVYSTTDGSVVRKGSLKDCGFVHEYLGRNLLYDIPETAERRRGIRLWDSVTDQTLFEYHNPRPQMTMLLSPMANLGTEYKADWAFALAETSGRVQVINGRTGRVKFEVDLGEKGVRGASSLKLFTDGTRYYLNVQNGFSGGGMPTLAADALLPVHQIMGDLYAIDPRTFEVLWVRKNIATQSVIQLADYRIPFLVTLNRTGRPSKVNNSMGLKLEVIDGQTGNTLAIHSNAANDRLLLMDYNRDAGRLRFRGGVTQLQVNFGRDVNRPVIGTDDLVRH